jgi:hypothetical protein
MKWWPTRDFPKGAKVGLLLKHANFEEEKDIEAGKAAPDSLDDFRNALRVLTNTPDGRTPSSIAVGCALRALRGKFRDGRKIVQAPKLDRTGVQLWQVANRDDKPSPPVTVSDSTDGGIDPPTKRVHDPAEDFDR